MSLQTRGIKKSGVEYCRIKLARIDEQEMLSSFMEDFLKNSAPHDDIGEPIASYSLVVAPVNVTDLDLGSPTSEAGPSVLITPNVDEAEMPAVIKENVNYNDSIEVSDAWSDGLKEQRDGHLATKKNGTHGSSFTGRCAMKGAVPTSWPGDWAVPIYIYIYI